MKKKTQTYWYITEITECVLCGHQTKYRYRVKEKPTFSIDYKQDACDIHFI